jgi:hypothetical protein
MASRRSRAFCKALHQEIGDDPQRWTTITAVADRLGIGQDKAEALAAELGYFSRRSSGFLKWWSRRNSPRLLPRIFARRS